jgi:hypothetical protein
MKITNLFERDIYRAINGVVKADQLDDASVWQELDEFVMTKELDQHFRNFFSTYGDAIKHPNDPAVAGKIGVWVSGFFGSGKSHFIKVLSYLLHNRTHHHNGDSKAAVEFFDSKIKDAMLLGDVKRAVTSNTDVILFNIDSKADHRAGRDAILTVFLRVLNEMQGYSGDHPHLAHLERFLESKRKLEQFHKAFRAATRTDWKAERDAYHFHRDAVVEALIGTLKLSRESAEKWVDGAEDSFALTIENFCKWVKQYLDSKGKDHRIVFLVDEVGQFIGTDSHLMLNLQTITEELGTICAGRAWVIVTSQEDIDAVLGEMRKTKAHDFSKIQGRFRTRLSLSSANVDEVIQTRLLAKRPEVIEDLRAVFESKGDILKNQMTFTNCGMTLKPYKDGDDFIKNYPFAPYQFQLVQRVFERIRQAGATGLHLSRGERSILDAFQSAAKQVGLQEVGVLVPLYGFYPSIESFLDTAVKKTIDQAKENASLEPFDIHLLEALFLIRYVEEVKGTVDNLVTLFIDEIDADRLALRRKIEESLLRLEKETLISRNGDIYFFLTNEERDINREIKAVEITGGEGAKLLGELIFNDTLKDQRKYRYPVNKMDFTFNRVCDRVPAGSRSEGALVVSIVTPLNDDYEAYTSAKCVLESGGEGGQILIRLGNDDKLGRELRAYLQTDKYVKHKSDGTLPDSTRVIMHRLAEENRQRRGRLVDMLGDMLAEASYYVAGQSLNVNAASPMLMLDKALEYLVQNTFTKMGYLKVINPEPEKEVQAILRSNDIGQQTLKIEMPEGNKQALDEVRNHIQLAASASKQVILHEMIEKKYALRPYGWPEGEALILIARLLVLGEISLMMDGALLPVNKAYESLVTPAKRRKTLIIRRQTSDPKSLQNARSLGKELFHEMGPDGEDALFAFLQLKLRDWQATLNGYKAFADTGNYPGREETAEGLSLVRKLLGCDNSFNFFNQFNAQKEALSEFAEQYNDLTHFYDHQKQTWDKLQRAYARFQLNRMELERNEMAAPALRRMHEILAAPAPYGLIKEADGLINTVSAVNTSLVDDRRSHALEKINAHINSLITDIAAANGDESLSVACLKPLEALRAQVEGHDSLAHITQMEAEAVTLFDAAIGRVEEFARNREKATTANTAGGVVASKLAVKKQRIIEPAKLAQAYLETSEEVEQFLYALRKELEDAIEKNERVQIR